MKVADPQCKFRLGTNLGPIREQLKTENVREQGLEQPECFWVELSAYIAEYGVEPRPDEIVYETVNGARQQGVNVLTGKRGWHKRCDRDTTRVNRSAELTDNTIDATRSALSHPFSGFCVPLLH